MTSLTPVEQPPKGGGRPSAAPAKPEHAVRSWMVFQAGWIATKADMTGLSSERVARSFGEAEGSLITDWVGFIANKVPGVDQTVLNAFIPSRFEEPIGVARATTELETGRRELKSVYVAEQAKRAGVFKVMLAEVLEVYEGQPFVVMVAAANINARKAYERTGFVETGARNDENIVAGVRLPLLELEHPGQ